MTDNQVVLIGIAVTVGASVVGWFLNNLKKGQDERDKIQDENINKLHDRFELMTEKYVTHTELSRIETTLKGAIELGFENQERFQKQSLELLKVSMNMKINESVEEKLHQHEQRFHQ